MNQSRSKAGISRTLLMVAVASLIALVSIAVVTVRNVGSQNGDELIHACASSSNVRIVESSDDCRGNETHVSWNVQGPEGQEGPEGPQGPAGATDVNINLSEDGSAFGRGAAFILFDGAPGESTVAGFEGWSDLLSFQQGFQTPVDPNTGLSTGATQYDPIVVLKDVDRASAEIADRATDNVLFDTVDVHFTRALSTGQRVTHLSYKMEHVLVAGYQVSGTGAADSVPTEELQLEFEKLTVTYTEYNEAGAEVGTHSYQVDRSPSP